MCCIVQSNINVCVQFLTSPEYQNSRIISVYISMPEEVNTRDIVQARDFSL